MRFAPVAVLLVSVLACQQTDTAQKSSVSETTDLRATQTQLKDDWVAAANRDDATTVAGMYAEDAVFILPDGSVLNGRPAIQQALTGYFANASNLSVNDQSFDQSGDVVYVTGDFSEDVATPDKKTVKNNGRYIVVSKRQPDGKLLIVRHMGVAVAPPANP